MRTRSNAAGGDMAGWCGQGILPDLLEPERNRRWRGGRHGGEGEERPAVHLPRSDHQQAWVCVSGAMVAAVCGVRDNDNREVQDVRRVRGGVEEDGDLSNEQGSKDNNQHGDG